MQLLFSQNSVSYFINNTGYQGGALNELSSVIYIFDGAEINFICNHAEDKGRSYFRAHSIQLGLSMITQEHVSLNS